ncbi:MAG: hypothetical protein QNJ44_14705 [Rhodobacter sp.]|nr:hypothetical protein [Rhodobacter sp.]
MAKPMHATVFVLLGLCASATPAFTQSSCFDSQAATTFTRGLTTASRCGVSSANGVVTGDLTVRAGVEECDISVGDTFRILPSPRVGASATVQVLGGAVQTTGTPFSSFQEVGATVRLEVSHGSQLICSAEKNLGNHTSPGIPTETNLSGNFTLSCSEPFAGVVPVTLDAAGRAAVTADVILHMWGASISWGSTAFAGAAIANPNLDIGTIAVERCSGEIIGVDSRQPIQLFAIGGDGVVYHRWQQTSGGWNADWVSRAGSEVSQIEAVRNADDRVELFALGSDGQVANRFTRMSGAFDPSGFQSLGLPASGSAISQFSVARDVGGRIQLFAVAEDGVVYHQWQKIGGGWNDEGYGSLGGENIASVTSARSGDGRVHLFALDRDGNLHGRYQVIAGGGWNHEGFGPLGTVPGGIRQFTAATNADGLIELFAVGNNGLLYNRWQVPGFAWNSQGFQQFTGTDRVNSVEAGRSRDGRIELLVRANGGVVYQRWQKVGGGWNDQGFVHLTQGTTEVEIARNIDGLMELFTINSGRTFNMFQRPDGSWNPDGLQSMGGTGIAQIKALGST